MDAVDERVVVYFATQLVLQGEVMRNAVSQYTEAVGVVVPEDSALPGDVLVWAGVHGILTSAAIVSRILWKDPWPKPPKGCKCPVDTEAKAQYTAEVKNRTALRKALGIKDEKYAAELQQRRTVRNHVEHIDDRIEKHYAKHPPEESDWAFAPYNSRDARYQLGAIFYDPPFIVILGDTVKFMVLAELVADVAQKARQWLTGSGYPLYLPYLA